MKHQRWDLATRLFHWSLVLALLLSWVSQEENYIDVHIVSGYAVLALLGFRLIWGFVGGFHSRFMNFIPAPKVLLSYMKGRYYDRSGHNPLGALSVVALLLLLIAQSITGLFNSDELIYSGPFYHLVDSSVSDWMGAWHERLFWVLCGFMGLHVLAIAIYQLRGSDLIGPMLHGGEDGEGKPSSIWLGIAILVALLALGYVALSQVPPPVSPW